MQQERIDSKYVGIQPQSHDVLAALIFHSTRLPQDEHKLAEGLLAAAEKAPFLGRFVDAETGQLTDQARTSLKKLQETDMLAIEDDSFVMPDRAKTGLASQLRIYFKTLGIEALEQAAEAAGNVWLTK